MCAAICPSVDARLIARSIGAHNRALVLESPLANSVTS
jgi:hypothetical protein